MPSLKTAAITAGILLLTLFIVARFAPAGLKSQIGLAPKA